MTAVETFYAHLRQCPMIAIVRGITPPEAEGVAAAVLDAGFTIIEVPLNSPDAFASIGLIAKAFGERATVGAGTVLDPADVQRVKNAGGTIVVSPDTNIEVIRATVSAGLVSAPGYFTPSEGFAAIRAGAHAIKLFPAEAASPAVVKAQLAVLPKHIPLIVVGGVKPDTMAPWVAAGAAGFGLGSALYRPGDSAATVAVNARAFMAGLAAIRT